jgi:hypothetical protein
MQDYRAQEYRLPFPPLSPPSLCGRSKYSLRNAQEKGVVGNLWWTPTAHLYQQVSFAPYSTSKAEVMISQIQAATTVRYIFNTIRMFSYQKINSIGSYCAINYY